ncbi:MAG TPA: hypothetical protein VFE06_08340 [Acidobacteriaceae bacterium]|jgi:dTMP kinase|nr:hypothetical protein [Acidobacteriaceae bacterium]
MGKLITFEGLDASGKSTQITLLLKALAIRNIKHNCIRFPRTAVRGYGEAIAMFLRGEFGAVADVSPYLIAALFAADREAAKAEIAHMLQSSDIVIADRYAYSNFAFQAAKIVSPRDKRYFLNWIRHLEFEVNCIPRPNLSVFFDAPVDFVTRNLARRSSGDQRSYLKGQPDIHEQALDLQKKVADEYRALSASDPDFVTISVGDNRRPKKIHDDIVELLERRGML